MQKYTLLFGFLFLFSCNNRENSKRILFQNVWKCSGDINIGEELIFDTIINRDSSYVIFLSSDFSIYKDQVKIGTITKVNDEELTFITIDKKIGYYRVLARKGPIMNKR